MILVTGVTHKEFVSQRRMKMSQDVVEKTDLVIPKEYGIFLKEIKTGELKTIENLSKDLEK